MDSHSDSNLSTKCGDGGVVLSVDERSTVRCPDGRDGPIRLEQDENGYFHVSSGFERKARMLPDRAEQEIVRIRYTAMRDQQLSVKRLSGARPVKPKKRKLDGDPKLMFTTLAEVMKEGETEDQSAEMLKRAGAAEEQLFWQVYRSEVD